MSACSATSGVGGARFGGSRGTQPLLAAADNARLPSAGGGKTSVTTAKHSLLHGVGTSGGEECPFPSDK